MVYIYSVSTRGAAKGGPGGSGPTPCDLPSTIFRILCALLQHGSGSGLILGWYFATYQPQYAKMFTRGLPLRKSWVRHWYQPLYTISCRCLNPRRHSPFRHPSRHRGRGGDWCDPPRDWLMDELELRLKNQRVACHETKLLTPEFKVLGQPVTCEVRSMTQKWQKFDFADNLVSEQARDAI